MKTYTAKPGEIQREWFVVDADGKTLGRLATQIADRLRGKGKPAYTPHVDTGDFVIVVNAEKIAVTGSKLDTKIYYRHSGYPGGIKQRTLREQLDRRPTEVIRKAVKGMLPKNKPAYTPHVDTGDFVVVVNAEKITVTGSKLDTKIYYRHSGYPGGIKQRTLREQLDRRPTEVIRKAVKGMLPKNKLASAQLTKLKVYPGPDHPHAAQDPKPLELA